MQPIAAVVVGLAAFLLVAVAEGHLLSNPELDSVWERFKEHHLKKYKNKEHELKRRHIFEDHWETITEHNVKADLGHHSFRMGLTAFTDWTEAEFKALLTLVVQANHTSQSGKSSPDNVRVVTASSLPASVNWVTEGAVTPIKNQGQCGGCYSFSATGGLEGQMFLQTGQLVSLSEQNIIDCSTQQGDLGCNGGAITYAFEYVQQNGGLDTEASYPFTGQQGSCQYQASNSATQVVSWTNLPSGDEAALQEAVANVGPISVAIDASTIMHYRSGVYSSSSCSSTNLDHAVLAVGYGTSSGGQPYWLVKNSWGTHWGMNGYIEMARNDNNMCGIATAAVYPTV
jgi:cathepsin L